jgi:hypothetical protein
MMGCTFLGIEVLPVPEVFDSLPTFPCCQSWKQHPASLAQLQKPLAAAGTKAGRVPLQDRMASLSSAPCLTSRLHARPPESTDWTVCGRHWWHQMWWSSGECSFVHVSARMSPVKDETWETRHLAKLQAVMLAVDALVKEWSQIQSYYKLLLWN